MIYLKGHVASLFQVLVLRNDQISLPFRGNSKVQVIWTQQVQFLVTTLPNLLLNHLRDIKDQ